MTGGDFLQRILALARARAAALPAAGPMPPPRPGRFREALRRVGGPQVIAEIKRASPSRGLFAPEADAAALARAYRDGGAAAISVLTEPEFFLGCAEDLRLAAEASGLPVLRKDFLVDPRQVDESIRMGADALLLIVAALPGPSLARMMGAAGQAGIEALVEVHDGDELRRALDAGADLVGVNRRDLRTFHVDPERTFELVGAIPEGAVRVAESGVHGPEDVTRLGRAGYDAVLVGEHLVTSADPRAALQALRA